MHDITLNIKNNFYCTLYTRKCISEGAGRIIFQLVSFNALGSKSMKTKVNCFGNQIRGLFPSRHFVHDVNTAWRELLTSDSHQKKAKTLFWQGILVDETRLCRAATDGNASEVKSLLTHLVDINCARWITGQGEVTPLCQAARFGHNIVIQMLLDKGADPNMGSPLNLVVSNMWNSASTAKILLNGGADPNIKTNLGGPLGRAVLYNKKDVIKLLLDAGADPNTKSITGSSCLHVAARLGNKCVIKMLLHAGADPYAKKNTGETPLDIARKSGKETDYWFLSDYHINYELI